MRAADVLRLIGSFLISLSGLRIVCKMCKLWRESAFVILPPPFLAALALRPGVLASSFCNYAFDLLLQHGYKPQSRMT